jgi:hypothetical protein
MLGVDLDVIKMCNKMHASFKLVVEWGLEDSNASEEC